MVRVTRSALPSSSAFHGCVTCRRNYARQQAGRRGLTAEGKKKKKKRLSAASRSPRCHRAEVSDAQFFCPRSQTGQRRWWDGNYPEKSRPVGGQVQVFGKVKHLVMLIGPPTMFVFALNQFRHFNILIFQKED